MGYYCVLSYSLVSWPVSVSRLCLLIDRLRQASWTEGTQGEKERDQLFISDLFSCSVPTLHAAMQMEEYGFEASAKTQDEPKARLHGAKAGLFPSEG